MANHLGKGLREKMAAASK